MKGMDKIIEIGIATIIIGGLGAVIGESYSSMLYTGVPPLYLGLLMLLGTLILIGFVYVYITIIRK
jgi:hypothetical protein